MIPNLARLSAPTPALKPLAAERPTEQNEPLKSVPFAAKSLASNSWSYGLFECFNTYDCGFNCCVQHLLCMPCLVASALEKIDSPYSTCIGIGLFVGGAGYPFGGELITVVSGFSARREVANHYGIREGVLYSALSALCCMPCSNAQLVGTIAKREGQVYGCASLKEEKYATVVAPA